MMTQEQAMESAQRRKEYLKNYRRTHRAHVREYTRAWRSAHPDRVSVYNARYEAKRAQQRRTAQEAATDQNQTPPVD